MLMLVLGYPNINHSATSQDFLLELVKKMVMQKQKITTITINLCYITYQYLQVIKIVLLYFIFHDWSSYLYKNSTYYHYMTGSFKK